VRNTARVLLTVSLLLPLFTLLCAAGDGAQSRVISVMVYQGKAVLISEAAPEPQSVLTASVLREPQLEKLQFTVELKIKLSYDKLMVYTELDETIWELTPRIVGKSVDKGYLIDTDSYRDNIVLTLIGKPSPRNEFTAVQLISTHEQGMNSLLTVRIQTRPPTTFEQVLHRTQPLQPYLPIVAVATVAAVGITAWRKRRPSTVEG